MTNTTVSTEEMAGLPIFAGMTATEIEQLAEIAEVKSYQPGDVILNQGQNGQNLWVILEGKCQVVKLGNTDDSHTVDRSRVMACCEIVFRATAFRATARHHGSPPTQGFLGENRLELGPSDGTNRRFSLGEETSDTARLVTDSTHLPGGGLPIDLFLGSELPVEETGIPDRPVVDLQPPGRLPRLPRAELLNPGEKPKRLLDVPENLRPMPGTRDPTGRREPIAPSQVKRLSQIESNGRKTTGTETIDLMRRLSVGDASTAADAKAELIRRGFSALHVELARKLFSPDPRVRRELTRRLPGLQDVDAAPWLLWLCRDTDSDVRLLAITLLATSGAPELVRQVEQIARHDPDPRIRQQAERLTQQRGGRMR